MTACQHGHTAAVRLLLKQAAILVNAVDTLAQTALMVAARCGAHGAVVALLGHKGTPAVLANLADKDGNTALHLSSQHNHACIVNVLLGWKGINMAARNKAKEDAYAVATRMRHQPCVAALKARAGPASVGAHAAAAVSHRKAFDLALRQQAAAREARGGGGHHAGMSATCLSGLMTDW